MECVCECVCVEDVCVEAFVLRHVCGEACVWIHVCGGMCGGMCVQSCVCVGLMDMTAMLHLLFSREDHVVLPRIAC